MEVMLFMDLNEQMCQCGICEESKEKGIYIYKLFICHECEQNMVQTKPREDKYEYYLQKLKNINLPKLS